MNCKEVKKYLDAYIDEELEALEEVVSETKSPTVNAKKSEKPTPPKPMKVMKLEY